ncbi:MAG: hypothetical protein ACBZ72_06895 [Candidatus Bathyarchaeia archaeon]|jgi:uncharacterized membrane protein YvbJ
MVWLCLGCGAEQKDDSLVCKKCGALKPQSQSGQEKAESKAEFWKKPLGPTY